MSYREKYLEWLNSDEIDEDTKNELRNIKLEKELEDRFHKDLEFGTAGLRGKLGAGTNRINIYTVGKAMQAMANVIKSKGKRAMERGVAIAFDVRHQSEDFAKLAARIFMGNGIKVYAYDNIRSTPMISYTVRKLNNIAGIMITASHNPKDYNGIKVYWEEGSQILDDIGDEILLEVEQVKSQKYIKKISIEDGKEKGLYNLIDKDIDNQYDLDVLDLAINEDIDKEIRLVYTPLNGTGNKPVQRILEKRGFRNVYVVSEQEYPDPDFTTVGYPNPEYREAFEYSMKLGREKDADILIANDPDADRVAAMVKNEGDYVFINGNQMGVLLVNYILSQRFKKNDLPENGAIVKSIVTGDLVEVIGEKYGITTFETLTGFKNICGKANEFEKTEEYKFIFGFEESIGYVYSDMVRDKDAISTTMIIAEMAAYYKKQEKNLLDILNEIYDEFGYYLEELFSIELKGLEGKNRIGRMMKDIRENPIKKIDGMKLEKVIDYLNDETGNPKSDVLKFYMNDGSWYAIRPSGTEPKIKIYIYSKDKIREKSLGKIKKIGELVEDRMNNIR